MAIGGYAGRAAAHVLRLLLRAALVLGLTLAGNALASEDGASEPTLRATTPARAAVRERAFAFLEDPATPTAGVAIAGYALGIGSGISADRPLPVNVATANASHAFSLGYGLTDRVAVFASATIVPIATEATAPTTTSAGAMVQLTRPGAPLALSVSAAAVHEGTTGAIGVSALAAATLDQGPLRLGANVRADKAFAAGRDAVDAITTLGLSYRAFSALRVGVEYVGQDLEELGGADAEGGARHAAGPSVALSLDHGRYQVGVASAFGLNARSPRALLRAGLAVAF